MHTGSILPVGNKRRLGSTCSFLSANGCVYLHIYICIYASLSERLATQPIKQLHTVTNIRQPFRLWQNVSAF